MSSGSNRLMRRIRMAAFAALVLLAFTSCVDVVQYISGTGSTIDVYVRFALQKSAFEMANSFSDEPQDLDEMFEEEFEINEAEVIEELPPGVTADYRSLNTDFEYGFEVNYSASRETLASLPDDSGAFVPKVTSRGMTILLAEPGGSEGGGGGGEGDEFAAAFLGGAKYRVFVSRRLVSRISAARLVSGSTSTEVTVIELPDVWMVQFPTSLWLMAEETPSLEIVY
ncbi:MAG: hypothetical protein ACOC1U_03205 [Spirochaetota bacterium]